MLVDGGVGTKIDKEILKSTAVRIEALVHCYLKFQYPPMIDNINLHSYFMNAEKFGQYSGEVGAQVALLWKVYEVKSMYVPYSIVDTFDVSHFTSFIHRSCYIQEVICCLILLSDSDWHKRLSLLFDIFKCSGNDEMNNDDIVMAGQVIAMSLHRLWGTGEWDQVEWSRLTEELADEAYAKVSIRT